MGLFVFIGKSLKTLSGGKSGPGWGMLLTSLWGFNGYTPPGMRHCEVLDRDASEILFAASRMAKELGKDAGSS